MRPGGEGDPTKSDDEADIDTIELVLRPEEFARLESIWEAQTSSTSSSSSTGQKPADSGAVGPESSAAGAVSAQAPAPDAAPVPGAVARDFDGVDDSGAVRLGSPLAVELAAPAAADAAEAAHESVTGPFDVTRLRSE
jgi:hypothetical protein